MKKYVTELAGTFFLVLVIGLGGNPLAIGSMLMVMVYMGGHISGAHYNPAITVAMLMRRKITSPEAITYMVFQIVGSLLAAYTAYVVTKNTLAPSAGANATVLDALLVEVIFTFALTLVILNVATTKASIGNSYYGLAIGFTVLAAVTVGGPISGGAYNPAVGLGLCLIDTLVGGNNSLTHVWIYFLGPITGGILGAVVFGFTNPDEK